MMIHDGHGTVSLRSDEEEGFLSERFRSTDAAQYQVSTIAPPCSSCVFLVWVRDGAVILTVRPVIGLRSIIRLLRVVL